MQAVELESCSDQGTLALVWNLALEIHGTWVSTMFLSRVWLLLDVLGTQVWCQASEADLVCHRFRCPSCLLSLTRHHGSVEVERQEEEHGEAL
jgi:hypothetical protein